MVDSSEPAPVCYPHFFDHGAQNWTLNRSLNKAEWNNHFRFCISVNASQVDICPIYSSIVLLPFVQLVVDKDIQILFTYINAKLWLHILIPMPFIFLTQIWNFIF